MKFPNTLTHDEMEISAKEWVLAGYRIVQVWTNPLEVDIVERSEKTPVRKSMTRASYRMEGGVWVRIKTDFRSTVERIQNELRKPPK